MFVLFCLHYVLLVLQQVTFVLKEVLEENKVLLKMVYESFKTSGREFLIEFQKGST